VFVVSMRLSIPLPFVGSLVFTTAACRSSSPAKEISDAADWTMYGRTNDEQCFSPNVPVQLTLVMPLGRAQHGPGAKDRAEAAGSR